MNSQSLLDRNRLGSGAIVVGAYGRDIEQSPSKTVSHSQPPIKKCSNEEICLMDLEELSALLATLDIPTLHQVIQRRDRTKGSTFLGQGKMLEVKDLAEQSCAGLIAIDGELSGSQIRSIEALTGCQVIDREGIILEIFSQHASTSVARLQVEMARWEYLMPRLVGAWTHFSRQAGGGVRSKGMGEKQIEIDRRIGRSRISKLRKKLSSIQVETAEQRKLRKDALKVALVGYTNSGKTTIMQGLTQSSIRGQDQLFATLSAKIKSSSPLGEPNILFTDTVGFIGRLPHGLVESFCSTLAETLYADLLIHVVDVSHQRYNWQLETSEKVLEEIGATSKEMIYVFNKIDQVDQPELLEKIMRKKYPGAYWISAHNPEDIRQLSHGIREYFFARLSSARFVIPSSQSALISKIFSHSIVQKVCCENPPMTELWVRARPVALKKIEHLVKKSGGSVELCLGDAAKVAKNAVGTASCDLSKQDVFVL